MNVNRFWTLFRQSEQNCPNCIKKMSKLPRIIGHIFLWLFNCFEVLTSSSSTYSLSLNTIKVKYYDIANSLFLKNTCSSTTDTIKCATIPNPNIKIIVFILNSITFVKYKI